MVVVVKTAKVKKKWRQLMRKVMKTRKISKISRRIVSTEDDVPGTSFKNKDPQIFHNEPLKRWLKSRGASAGGSRRELLARFVVLSVFYELKRFSQVPAVSFTLIE